MVTDILIFLCSQWLYLWYWQWHDDDVSLLRALEIGTSPNAKNPPSIGMDAISSFAYCRYVVECGCGLANDEIPRKRHSFWASHLSAVHGKFIAVSFSSRCLLGILRDSTGFGCKCLMQWAGPLSESRNAPFWPVNDTFDAMVVTVTVLCLCTLCDQKGSLSPIDGMYGSRHQAPAMTVKMMCLISPCFSRWW